jgi:hypothetical protein
MARIVVRFPYPSFGWLFVIRPLRCYFAPLACPLSQTGRAADLQRYHFLFVCGNYSRILSSVHRTAPNFDIRRAFSAYQLATILSEGSHTFVLIEHDQGMYDGTRDMIPVIAQTLKQLSHETTIVLYSPAPDRAFRSLIRDANRVYCLSPGDDGENSRSIGHYKQAGSKGNQKKQQTTLETGNEG